MDRTPGSDDMLAEEERDRREEAEETAHAMHVYDSRCPICIENDEADEDEDEDEDEPDDDGYDPADQASYWREGWDEHDDRL